MIKMHAEKTPLKQNVENYVFYENLVKFVVFDSNDVKIMFVSIDVGICPLLSLKTIVYLFNI